jgi:hypothetical protein
MPLELAVPRPRRPPLRTRRARSRRAARVWPTLFGYQVVIEAERA